MVSKNLFIFEKSNLLLSSVLTDLAENVNWDAIAQIPADALNIISDAEVTKSTSEKSKSKKTLPMCIKFLKIIPYLEKNFVLKDRFSSFNPSVEVYIFLMHQDIVYDLEFK